MEQCGQISLVIATEIILAALIRAVRVIHVVHIAFARKKAVVVLVLLSVNNQIRHI